MTRIQNLLSLIALLGAALCAQAAPYLPASGAQVIETLPRRGDPVQQELRRLRAQLNAQPNDVALAATLARRYIALGRSETDPRYLGYAQAALAPWWRQPAPPPEVRLLRATLLQSTHQFPAALADLQGVLAQEPKNAQAWLTLATVQTVQGDYASATSSCARLSALANELITVTCVAQVGAVTGRAAPSEKLLALTLERSGATKPELQVWVLTLLAEMAQRRDAATVAEARFQRALALDPHDSYLLGAYSDFLLEQKRPSRVEALLADQTRIDALLLRRALALQQQGKTAPLAADVAELAARFDAAMLRGDTVHQREQARFELLRRDATKALALARKNWAIQKEPADMRIYLEAAVQARDREAAQPVLDWIAKHKTEDAAAARLVRQLGESA
ncbi:tetratricopeptide repeat protein [Duganella phyllosphaerae]|uniref:Beta-barrel assembly-enhancing protease n=1 Tax=Duganella phyllosphaerae TaxID=762836 RepID=A0A1E7WVY3_9BURK|nr:tetratricopeptide repeat protein [Duganella phyllosphaerae]OFA03972.1 beta-barrel assembly-enhancing protease [Duganella phyllosphaerae]